MTTTDPTQPPAPIDPPPPPAPTLSDLVAQAEADLAVFQTAAQTAATSAAQAQSDAAKSDAAKALAHTDFVNLAAAVAAADPGAPGVTAAIRAFKKFGALSHA